MTDFKQKLFAALYRSLAERRTAKTNGLIIFGTVLAVIATGAYIVLSVLIAPPHMPSEQFAEGGTITALSSIYLAMAGAASLIGFYLLLDKPGIGKFFWLIAGLGLVFLSLDELVQIHERIDMIVSSTKIGKPEILRNWNDLVVMLYGAGGLIVGLLFLPELLRFPKVLETYATGFAFYVVHTVIDTVTTNPTPLSIICEESAKLMCVLMLLLASITSVLAIIDGKRASWLRSGTEPKLDTTPTL
ncbi:MAG: hypothetical protein HKN11_16970 [Rhizobiales bacterium]|nr:hypothetical protein [Hyphomicrobiales bacterium]